MWVSSQRIAILYSSNPKGAGSQVLNFTFEGENWWNCRR